MYYCCNCSTASSRGKMLWMFRCALLLETSDCVTSSRPLWLHFSGNTFCSVCYFDTKEFTDWKNVQISLTVAAFPLHAVCSAHIEIPPEILPHIVWMFLRMAPLELILIFMLQFEGNCSDFLLFKFILSYHYSLNKFNIFWVLYSEP